jgi:glycosyltransferase involved in cell wall biosynthesis
VPESRVTGFRFATGDDAALASALLRLFFLAEPIRNAMGRRGRDWVLGHFDGAGIVEQTLRLYGEIAGRACTPAQVPRSDKISPV